MNANPMKRKIAAMLCMAMMGACACFGALADNVATPGEANTNPPAAQTTTPPPVSVITPAPQQTTAAPVQTTPPAPSFIKIQAALKDNGNGTFTVTVTDAAAGEPVIAYVDGLSGQDAQLLKGESATFTVPSAGKYNLAIEYLASGEGIFKASVDVSAAGAVPPTQSKIADVQLSVTHTDAGKKDGVISGTIIFTGNASLTVNLYEGSTRIDKAVLAPGSNGQFAFAGLSAGAYELHAYFDGGSAPAYSAGPIVQAYSPVITPTPTPVPTPTPTPTPAPQLAPIQITGVNPGVSMLSVTGTASAGQQILLTTDPAATSNVYAVVDAGGAFKANIPCAAGAYTAVTAKYVSDQSITLTLSGNWVVAAPAQKPDLTVDAVDDTSTTVIAKTDAGVVVVINASDYSQTVTADANGILRFSLPHTYAAGTKLTFTVHYGANQTFTQDVTVQSASYLGVLEYGDTGAAVEKLTERLAQLGYPVSKTSRYGSTVREAVRLFQLANGLDGDGIAGIKTQQALFSVSAIPYGSNTYPTLVRGDKGYALIYTLQQRLKDLGYYTIKVDGIYGSGTERAIRLFQQVNGLHVTGKADNATQTLLYSAAAKPLGYGASSTYETLSRSSKYKSAVVTLQRRLKDLGYYAGSVDGYFGSQTYRAVRNFQRRNGLDVTGIADPTTQSVLFSSSAKKASGSSSSSSSSTGYRLLYWGCRGDAVKRLQNALISAGYKSIVRAADGIYGQWTYDAVRAYQKDHKLSVDGIAGKNTQNSLYGTNY